MGEVDPTFIQELEHRPKPSVIEAHGISQIDLAPFMNSTPTDTNDRTVIQLVAEVGDASKNWGFFQVKRKTDGEWIFVKPTPNAFIINFGTLFRFEAMIPMRV